jgi:hypothetical protein
MGQQFPDTAGEMCRQPLEHSCWTPSSRSHRRQARWDGWTFTPNLPDEADNHLIELGVAAQADAIVTRKLRDVSGGESRFPSLRVLTPEQCLEVFRCPG